MKASAESIGCRLLANNWRPYQDYEHPDSLCFWKRFPSQHRCRCNDEKEGIKVCCFVSDLQWRVSCELELTGELPDGTWFRTSRWGLPKDLPKVLSLIPAMIRTWDFACSQAEAGPEDTRQDSP